MIAPEHLPQVSGGSVMRIKGTFYPYSVQGNGLSMQMTAVQIIDLVEAKVSSSLKRAALSLPRSRKHRHGFGGRLRFLTTSVA